MKTKEQLKELDLVITAKILLEFISIKFESLSDKDLNLIKKLYAENSLIWWDQQTDYLTNLVNFYQNEVNKLTKLIKESNSLDDRINFRNLLQNNKHHLKNNLFKLQELKDSFEKVKPKYNKLLSGVN